MSLSAVSAPPLVNGAGDTARGATVVRTPSTGRWRRAAVIVGIWSLVGLFGAQQGYFALTLAGHSVAWWRLLVLNLYSVWLWAAFTPAMVWLARRFQVDRRTWRTALPIHAAFAFAFAFADVLFDRLVPPWASPFPPLPLLDMFVRQLDVNLFSYIAVVAIAHAAAYYALYQERQVATAQLSSQLATAQLNALRAQLQPHFLFNTLNAVAELVHVDPEAADHMVTRLGALLRRSIATLGEHEVSLRAELEFLQMYVDVVRVRFGSRVEVTVDADPEALDAAVPTLLLQPLVENALRHGIEPLPDGGRVEVVARRRLDMVELEVRDTGRGLPGGEEPLREGVGLRNTRDRLRQLYGDAHHFAVRPRAGGGVIVSVSVPWRRPAMRPGEDGP